MKRRKLSLVALTLSAVMLFTACNNTEPDTPDNGGTDDPQVEETDDPQNDLEEPGAGRSEDEIVIWSGVTGPDGDLIQQNFDEYNATNPEYPVRLYAMEGGTLETRLITATRSGTDVPDLALVAAESISQYANQGLIEPWDEFIDGTEVNADNYVAEAWDVGTHEGQQFGLPTTMGTWLMYYNKTLVDEYMPGALDDNIITFEEIEAGGDAAVADGYVPYGLGWPFQNYNNLYLQMGGTFADDTGRININNDIARETTEYFKHLYEAGYTQEEGEDTVGMFMNGEILILPEGTWMLSQMEEITDFEWGQTFIPQWDADNLKQGSGASQFVRFLDEDRPAERVEASIEFIDWLRTNTLTWLESGENTASLAMLENEEYLAMSQSFLVETQEARDSLVIVTDEGSSIVFGAIDGSLWDMITGRVDIVERLNEIQQEVNDTMNY